MPQDPLQIALEHHRNGRLTQAEAIYRKLLADDPNHLEVNHWLGVLLTQANLAEEALPLLKQAADGNPTDAAAWHNLGQAAMSAGKLDQAIAAMEQANRLSDSQAIPATFLAQAYLLRRDSGDADRAVQVLSRVVDSAKAGDPASANQVIQPELRYNLGLALVAAGRAVDAIEPLTAAIAGRADYLPAMFQLAQAYAATRQMKESRKLLNKVLEIDPGHARAWYALASLDADAGNLPIAAALYRKAIKAKRDFVGAHMGLGFTLSRMGKKAEADQAFAEAAQSREKQAKWSARPSPETVGVEALQKRLTPDETGHQLHQALAGLMNLISPAQIDAEEVTNLFDRYADRFDAHLRTTLQYHAPELIVKALRPHLSGQPGDVVDLGCGTGLCGPLLRPFARMLIGVDLSAAMLDKARLLGLYDRLDHADLVSALNGMVDQADVLTAADVLLYLGDLSPVFESAYRALRLGGLFTFSVEAGQGDRFRLGTSTRRYVHSAEYLHHLAKIYGFETKGFEAVVLRVNANQPVQGFVMVLRKQDLLHS